MSALYRTSRFDNRGAAPAHVSGPARGLIAGIGLLASVLAVAACGDNLSPQGPVAPDARLEPDPNRVQVTFLVTVPANTPAGSKVHIAGNFQGWDPGSADHALTRRDDGRYAITLDLARGDNIEFKFTRGSWETVEKDAEGQEIGNRLLTLDASGTQEFTVARWADGTPPPSTITGNIETTVMPGFLDGRRIWVYLPPDYGTDTEARYYPVLYMFDGQNVFDAATSFAGEWQVDETLETMIPAGDVRPIIVVAVDHGGDKRREEYTPWANPDDGGGQGGAHLQAIVDTLVPYVDQTYRTIATREGRALSGSSLGGLMSLYAAYEHDDVFGQVAALSPSLWWDDQHMLRHADAAGAKPAVRVYMDMGTLEEGNVVDEDPANGTDDNIDQLRAMRDELVSQGFVLNTDLEVVEAPDARHSESYWAMRFPDVLRFLFPPESTRSIRR
jgi:predicted alpha/beta superfamily hydrolase